MKPQGALVMSFCNGEVIVEIRSNKIVSVTKKGSIIIKDKKQPKEKK
jgi:hypothetical protein